MTQTADWPRCKKWVHDEFASHQCSRRAWKDGYCKQHHPDTVAARRAAVTARHIAKVEQSPALRLARANRRIADLEQEIAELRAKLEERA